VFVAGQIGVTAVLLVTAALLTRSLIAAQRTAVGFEAERLALLSLDTGMVQYSPERSERFYDAALERVRRIPGLERAALATRVPFSLNANQWEVWVPERHRPGEHGETVEVTTVSPEYFVTIGVRIVQGRGFTGAERPNTPFAAVVNDAFARRFWPGEAAVGKTFRSRNSDGPLFEIIGVAADYKVRTLTEGPTPLLHVARSQRPNAYSFVIARTRGDAAALLGEMRRELLALEPNLVFVESQTMDAEVAATLFPARAGAWLVGGVGAMAMVLAAIGLYGVIAYSVARRTREMGIRIAMGARPASVLGLAMRQGLLVTAAGVAAGCLLAIAAARAVAGVLYGVAPSDPVAWTAALSIVSAVSVLANLLPASRAARVNPSIALRTE
jgi:predicted permease